MSDNRFLLAPSLLACDFARAGEQLDILENSNVPWLHLDVMDGAFVPNISFGQPLIKSLRRRTKMFFDTHLMINDPIRYVDDFVAAGADLICIHSESTDDPAAALKAIKERGVQCGVAIKPNTSVDSIVELMPLCDLVLVMSVEPGFGGQKFMPIAYEKVRQVAAHRARLGLDFHIEVDGGVDSTNAKQLCDCGANVLVAGSSVLGKPDIAAAAAAIYDAVK